ncbi:hypothetical protein BDN72DRAFT_847325, partial [Pluteus cervinus]
RSHRLYRRPCRYRRPPSQPPFSYRASLVANLRLDTIPLCPYQVYLSTEASVAYPKDKPGQDIGGVDQILLTNICWSSDGDSTLEYDITGGKWAGDRFDVNVVESVQADAGDGEENQWKDVTQQVINSVGRIWRSQF